MKSERRKAAFTIIELTVIVCTLALLAAMMLPALAGTSTKSQRIICVNNLKETYLGFKIWEGENGDQFPMAVSTASGGGKEYVYSYANQFPPTYSPYSMFQVASNQLVTPKILYCPADINLNLCAPGVANAGPIAHTGTYSTNFTQNVFNDAYISYFVGGDATEVYPGMVIFGDRNIGTAGTIANTPTPANVMFPDAYQIFNLHGSSAATWAWTALDQHLGAGNLGLADGSVAQLTVNGLRQALIQVTNGIPGGDTIGPYYNFP